MSRHINLLSEEEIFTNITSWVRTNELFYSPGMTSVFQSFLQCIFISERRDLAERMLEHLQQALEISFWFPNLTFWRFLTQIISLVSLEPGELHSRWLSVDFSVFTGSYPGADHVWGQVCVRPCLCPVTIHRLSSTPCDSSGHNMTSHWWMHVWWPVTVGLLTPVRKEALCGWNSSLETKNLISRYSSQLSVITSSSPLCSFCLINVSWMIPLAPPSGHVSSTRSLHRAKLYVDI